MTNHPNRSLSAAARHLLYCAFNPQGGLFGNDPVTEADFYNWARPSKGDEPLSDGALAKVWDLLQPAVDAYRSGYYAGESSIVDADLDRDSVMDLWRPVAECAGLSALRTVVSSMCRRSTRHRQALSYLLSDLPHLEAPDSATPVQPRFLLVTRPVYNPAQEVRRTYSCLSAALAARDRAEQMRDQATLVELHLPLSAEE